MRDELTPPLATTSVPGRVKPDGTSITVDADGTIHSTSSGGMSNPMTAAGDLILGGSAGAPTRLPVVASSLLSSNAAGAVSWLSLVPAAMLPAATSSVKGAVIPDGTIITIDGTGHITVPQGSSTALGVAQVDGTTLSASAGVFGLNIANKIPTAWLGTTATTAAAGSDSRIVGAVQIGGDLGGTTTSPTVTTVVHCTTAQTLPAAVAVQDGSLSTVSASKLSGTIAAANLPIASSTVLGAVKVDGTTITANASGVITTTALTNPMTAANDIIVGGTSGAATRLAVTNSAVLTSGGTGTVAWSTTVPAANLPAATTSAQGAVQLAGDLAGTATSPQVVGVTHMTGTLPTAVTVQSASLPVATAAVLGAVKPDGVTITNVSGATSVTYGTSANTALQGSLLGAASGVASLDATTKVPIAQIPTGTSGTTVALGNAAPNAHAASHLRTGTDPIAWDLITTPQMHGMVAWTVANDNAANTYTLVINTQILAKIWVPISPASTTNVVVNWQTTTAASPVLTSGQAYVGIYLPNSYTSPTTTTLLGSTDVSSQLSSTGAKTATVTCSPVLPYGNGVWAWVVFVMTVTPATTSPAIAAKTGMPTALTNLGLTTATSRVGTLASGTLAAFTPSTLTQAQNIVFAAFS